MQPGWCQPVKQEFMENECDALPGVAYPGVRDNRSTINTKTKYDDECLYLIKTSSSVKIISSKRFSAWYVHSYPFNKTFIINGKSHCCNDTFTDVQFTSPL